MISHSLVAHWQNDLLGDFGGLYRCEDCIKSAADRRAGNGRKTFQLIENLGSACHKEEA
jgi:hypothetical protein